MSREPIEIPYYQVAAFSRSPFAGNPAGVCPLEEWLPESLMQRVARENNLPETAFLVPEGRGRYAIRWFSPTQEIDLCGHATLASAYALYAFEGETAPELVFSGNGGQLSVSKKPDGQLGLTLAAAESAPAKEELLSQARELTGLAIKEAWRSPYDVVLVVDSAQTVAAFSPDIEKLASIEARGVALTAPDGPAAFVSRFFGPRSGIPEDPVTGSAHAALAPFWAERLGKNELEARQLSARGGELRCVVTDGTVELTGAAALYLRGTLRLPAG